MQNNEIAIITIALVVGLCVLGAFFAVLTFAGVL